MEPWERLKPENHSLKAFKPQTERLRSVIRIESFTRLQAFPIPPEMSCHQYYKIQINNLITAIE